MDELPHTRAAWPAAEAAIGARPEAIVYALAGATYVLAGLLWKPLLNWVIGPVWIVMAVWFGSNLYRAHLRRRR